MFDVPYAGISIEKSKEIIKKNKILATIKNLQEIDWSEIDQNTIELVGKIIDGKYECPECAILSNQKEECEEKFKNFAFQTELNIIGGIEHNVENALGSLPSNEKDDEVEYSLKRIQEIVTDEYKELRKKFEFYLPEDY